MLVAARGQLKTDGQWGRLEQHLGRGKQTKSLRDSHITT